MTKKLSKYVYQCPLSTCKMVVSMPISPSDYPTCQGEGNTHYKMMDFMESKSGGVPSHVEPSDKKRKEGRWID